MLEALGHNVGGVLWTGNQQSGTILQFLPSFNNLTHLSLGGGRGEWGDINAGDPAELPIVSTLKACPNLKCLTFSSIYSPVIYNEVSESINQQQHNKPQQNNMQSFFSHWQLKSLTFVSNY